MDERVDPNTMISLDDSNLNRVQVIGQEASNGSPMGMNNLVTMTASDLDLRKTKNELFSKLVERQPQQMIVTTPSKTSSDDNLTNLSRTTNDLSRLVAGCRRASSKDDLCADQTRAISGEMMGLQHRETVTFSRNRGRWYTNDEVAGILTSFSSHPEWQTNELQLRPKSGAVLLYSREKVRYRQDGYCWKKRKNGRTTREDHMKLKVQGIECIYGCYVHSAILPTFHRRCYWLLENPDIVLVHYLNQPPDDKNKMILTFDPDILEADTRRKWTNEEIIEEIGSVFGGISQIHHTLNINFPVATPPATSEHMLAGGLQASPGYQDGDFGDHMDMSSTDEQMLSCGELDSGVSQARDQLNSCGNLGVDNKDCRLINGNNDEDDEMVALESAGELNDNNNNNNNNNTCRQDNTETIIENMAGSNQAAGSSTKYNSLVVSKGDQLVRQQQSGANYDLNVVLIDNQDDQPDLLNNSKTFYESGSTATTAAATTTTTATRRNYDDGRQRQQQQSSQPQCLEQSPCSPVTQIYNKIVDDIETYVLPMEPDHYGSSHNHDHVHGHHLQQGILAQKGGADQHQNAGHLQQGAGPQVGHSIDLAPCDLFSTCGQTGDVDGLRRNDGDMLLSDFNLGQNSDDAQNQIATDNSLPNFDLLMGKQSADYQCNDASRSHLLIGDNETMDLFSYKPSDCGESHKFQLDVKSTTSDTDTMNRLSPMIPVVPRCNSTDNALRSSLLNQHLDQYQHHASSNFLSNEHPLGSAFSEYVTHQANGPLTNNCSTTSTEPSNSTSCSASPSSSPHLNASNVGVNFACLAVAAGPVSAANNQAYIKLPLQQRQNSEQKEPSNSVLNSLLPKALSLDGSELSSQYQRHSHLSSHHHHHNHQHRHHAHHQHGHNHNHQQQHQHKQQHHNLRTSPLIGAYGHPRVEHNLRFYPDYNMPQQQQQQQQSGTNCVLLSTPATMSSHPLNRQQMQNCYQRPSVPSISPGNYSLDSSSPANKFLANGLQYRSGSAQATNLAAASNPLSRQHAQDQQKQTGCRRLEQALAAHPRALPILDYVPNWSPSAGGTKVLLIGNWMNLLSESASDFNCTLMSKSQPFDSSSFSVLFDDLIVQATLIQDNVIRCYAPQHEPGFITLKVLYKDLIVSEQVLFEIRAVCEQTATTATEITTANAATDNQDQSLLYGQAPSAAQRNEEEAAAPSDRLALDIQGQEMDSTCIS